MTVALGGIQGEAAEKGTKHLRQEQRSAISHNRIYSCMKIVDVMPRWVFDGSPLE